MFRTINSVPQIFCVFIIAVVAIQAISGSTHAQMTAKEFDALPDGKKRSVLVDALQKREEAVANLRAMSATKIYNVKFRDGKAGEVIEKVARNECELRRIDGSYWARIDYFRKQEPDQVRTRVFTSRAADSDIVKSIARDGKDGPNRQIDPESGNSQMQMAHFHYWFDAGFDRDYEFPISFLLKQQEAIKFEGLGDDDKSVKISLLYETANGTPFKDFRTMWLDPQKGFMPVRMERRWEYELPKPFFSVMDTEVSKLEQIGGVWFPTHFTTTCTGRVSIEKEYATVYETTVGEIKLEKMTDKDLEENFADWVAREKPADDPGKAPPPAAESASD